MSSGEKAPGYNLVTLMKRLEAATSRLEDLTVYQADALKKAGSTKTVTIDPTPKQDDGDVAMKDAKDDEEEELESGSSVSQSLQDYDEFVAEFVDPFVVMSKSIDPLVEEQVMYLAKAFEGQRKMIEVAEKAQNPKDFMGSAFQELFGPVVQQGSAISNVRESNRTSAFSNHLATISEGVQAVGWVTADKPATYITDFKDSAQFWANKVMKEYKDTDKKQVEWVQHFAKLLNALQAYVKKHHTGGLAWNPDGKPLAEALKESTDSSASAAPPASAPPAAGAGGAPPPPPPPPASVFQVQDDKPAASGSGGMDAVFADLNKGEGITKSLKKVDKSEMTHKNPELRKQAPAPVENKKSGPVPPKKPSSLSKKKPSRMELQDSKWIIENFENEHEKLVIDGTMDQSVFIDRCSKCTIQVKGKVNTIFLNQCSEVAMLAENLVASIEYVRCKRFQVQITGTLPTLAIDQCDGGQIFLGDAAKEVEIYTSQSTGLNVNVAKDEAAGDYSEVPVPEQLVHRIGKDGSLVTEVVELKEA